MHGWLTEVVTSRERLRRFEPEWRELAERLGNPFVSPDWFSAWLDCADVHSEPHVVVCTRSDGSLAGLMPLVAEHSGRLGSLRFAGAAFADRLGPVCLPGEERKLIAATGAALAGAPGAWRALVLDNVDASADWWRELAGTRPLRGFARLREATLPAIDFDAGGFDAYLATRSRDLREKARRAPRGLERAHRVRYVCASDPAELEQQFSTLFALHDARRSDRGGSSLASRRAREFQLRFARAALERGWLRLWLLEADGAAVAAWLGWRVGDRYLYYQAGFDPAWSRHSVGFVLLLHTIRAAAEEGASCYDLLLGDEPYKGRLATTEAAACTVTCGLTAGARMLAAAEASLWRASRYLSPQMRARAVRLAAALPTARAR